MHLNCNNKFEVHHHPAPLFLMICIPVPSEGPWSTTTIILLSCFHKICVFIRLGKEIIKTKNH